MTPEYRPFRLNFCPILGFNMAGKPGVHPLLLRRHDD